MKKFFLSSFFALVIFAGIYFVKDTAFFRGLFQQAPTNQIEKHLEPVQEKSYQGTVKSLGTFAFPDSGSHFLEMENRMVLLLIGLGVDMNRYIGMKVEVHGRLTSTPSGKELLQVLTVNEIPADSSIISKAEMGSYAWSLVQIGDLGISFQKRDAWEVTISDDSIRLRLVYLESDSKQGEDFIEIQKLSNPKKLSLDAYPDIVLSGRSHTVNKIGPDSLTAYQFSNEDGSLNLFVARGDDSVYRLQYLPAEKKSGDRHRNDFYELLSTFRFIPFL